PLKTTPIPPRPISPRSSYLPKSRSGMRPRSGRRAGAYTPLGPIIVLPGSDWADGPLPEVETTTIPSSSCSAVDGSAPSPPVAALGAWGWGSARAGCPPAEGSGSSIGVGGFMAPSCNPGPAGDGDLPDYFAPSSPVLSSGSTRSTRSRGRVGHGGRSETL